MSPKHDDVGLLLTEDEANAMLAMCLTSPHKLDGIAESALRKLAHYCIKSSHYIDSVELELIIEQEAAGNE